MKKALVGLLFISGYAWGANFPPSLVIQNQARTPTSVGYQTGGSSVPVSVLNTLSATAVAVTTGPFGGAMSGIGAAIGFVGPAGFQAGKVDQSSNVFTLTEGLVSSSTVLSAARPNLSTTTIMLDPYGRLVTVSGVPTSIQFSTTPAAITGVTTVVLVSSPSATSFVHVCGCIITNTSATNAYVTFLSSGAIAGANTLPVAAPANYYPTGFPFDCSNPMYNGYAGSQVGVQSSASVTSLLISCRYYTSDTP